MLLPCVAIVLYLFFPLLRSCFHRSKDIQISIPTSFFAANFNRFAKNTVIFFFFFSHCLCAAGRLPSRQTLTRIRGKCPSFRKVVEVLMVFSSLFLDSHMSRGDRIVLSPSVPVQPRRRKALKNPQGKHANCRVFLKTG